jgi:hypothetical protein
MIKEIGSFSKRIIEILSRENEKKENNNWKE